MKPVFDPSRFSNSIDSESRWNSPRVFTRAGIQGFLIFLIGILLSGCVDYQQSMPILPMGASPNEVQTIIGPPKSKSRDGSLSTWNYGDGAVCVFKEGKLVASNLSSPSQYSSYVSSGVTLPPVSVNVVPAVYPPAVYYGGGGGGAGVILGEATTAGAGMDAHTTEITGGITTAEATTTGATTTAETGTITRIINSHDYSGSFVWCDCLRSDWDGVLCLRQAAVAREADGSWHCAHGIPLSRL